MTEFTEPPVLLQEVSRDAGNRHEQCTDAPATAVEASTEVPDGGYGWVVIGACAVITWWFGGTMYSWGVIQSALVNEGVSQASTLSFVGALAVSFIAVMAIPNARIVQKLGAQKTGLLGVYLLGFGGILSSFTTRSVSGLFATNGVITGFGTR